MQRGWCRTFLDPVVFQPAKCGATLLRITRGLGGVVMQITGRWNSSVTIVCCLCAIVTGCERRPSGQGQADQLRSALLAKADADSLAAAALLPDVAETATSSERLQWIARARSIEPERADLTWLHIELCARVRDCDPAPLEAVLREIDPDNAAGWYGELVRATGRNDRTAVEAGLVGMAAAEQFDVYWNRLLVALTGALVRSGRAELSEAYVNVNGWLAATATPALAPTVAACEGNSLVSARRLAACRGVARAMMRGDGTVVEMIGAAIAVRVWPKDSSEWLAAIEARRAADYRLAYLRREVNASGAALANSLSSDAVRADMRRATLHRREQDALRARMIDAGENPEPPAGWSSEASEQLRANGLPES